MVTPVVMLVLLMAPWVLGRWFGRPGARALGPVFVFAFTGVGHFVETEALERMLPAWVPYARVIVIVSGVFELVLAAALAWRPTRTPAAWTAIAFLVAAAPLNVFAALNRVGPGGHAWGPGYLWIRLPLQLVIVAACYFWLVRPAGKRGPRAPVA